MMDAKRSTELPKPVKKFYKGEPLALGITQILIGILGMAFGVVLSIYEDYREYITGKMPYWTGVLYIISGSLSVAAARNPKPSMVKGMLGMNVVSAVVAGMGIAFLSAALERVGFMDAALQCTDYNTSEVDQQCYEILFIPFNITNGMFAVLLLFTVLEFCISISSAAFGCKTVCRCQDTYNETIVVVYQNAFPNNAVGLPVVPQNAPPDNAVSLAAACKDAESP